MDLKGSSITGGVFLAYSIIILHALIIALLFIFIIFFRGIVHYILWITLTAIGLTFLSGLYFFRKLRKNSQKLKDILNDPAFAGRTIEIGFLGGAALLKLNPQTEHPIALGYEPTKALPHLNDNDKNQSTVNDLNRLGKLLEQDLITRGEFDHLKKEILDSKK
jgi:glucan phosphoethanolaminetransferase (alkaline phosphatase superfamily)